MSKNIKILSLISIISVMALVSISCNKKSTEYHMPSAGTYIDAKGLAVVVTIIDEKTFQVKGEIEGTKKSKSSFNITCTGDEYDVKNGYYFGKTISGTVDGKELTEAITGGGHFLVCNRYV